MIENWTQGVVALDIGGVCLNIHYEKMAAYFGWREPPAQILALANHLEAGELNVRQWLTAFREIAGGRFADEQILSGWNRIIGAPIEGMRALLAQLKNNGLRLVFFSDTSSVHVEQIFNCSEIASLVDGAVYSFEVGAQKPSAEMYEAFEQHFGVPELYLDDKPANIAAGLARGWPSRQFTGVSALHAYLNKSFFRHHIPLE